MSNHSYQLHYIPSGEAGTRATLKLMAQLVKKYKTTKPIRELALQIVETAPAQNWVEELRAIHNWVRSNIRYTRDVLGVETLQTPIETLRLGHGDCDDMSVLFSTLAAATGHPTLFMAVGFGGGNFSHVLPLAKIGNRWAWAECTKPLELGERPRNITKKMVQHI